jgi:hypothetical protein
MTDERERAHQRITAEAGLRKHASLGFFGTTTGRHRKHLRFTPEEFFRSMILTIIETHRRTSSCRVYRSSLLDTPTCHLIADLWVLLPN